MRRAAKYRLLKSRKLRCNLSGTSQDDTLAAAAEFVWAVDSGDAINPESLRAVRDALDRILRGDDPSIVFPTRLRRGQRADTHDRDLVVASFIEHRRRRRVADGSKTPLEDAKNEAAKAFPWPSRASGVDGAGNAWNKHRGKVEVYSDTVLENLLDRFECK